MATCSLKKSPPSNLQSWITRFERSTAYRMTPRCLAIRPTRPQFADWTRTASHGWSAARISLPEFGSSNVNFGTIGSWSARDVRDSRRLPTMEAESPRLSRSCANTDSSFLAIVHRSGSGEGAVPVGGLSPNAYLLERATGMLGLRVSSTLMSKQERLRGLTDKNCYD